ncbi:hypothetical protein B0I72DRAFT_132113 [Yarrowia lipolytica]|uniref:Uncharacterized protein n=1 Tax=Yarrowia lipolytica TaxID=4952 RepID=A0A371CDI8_YARLL|nr:hypothetical protein B0I71DRAFT_127688 [Yarrowia lipolytica]RDW35863.1 hypothetical protein B0I72DRAFT_132113 [Yarrowia lipolytica]RDW49399.1 hypothetical protein B0I74DRAFT_131784 [Yarrowia lipolytica]RDW55599.1 hypothetical protein B0I75DRAFT_132868 [Yarrowia lipolytica]
MAPQGRKGQASGQKSDGAKRTRATRRSVDRNNHVDLKNGQITPKIEDEVDKGEKSEEQSQDENGNEPATNESIPEDDSEPDSEEIPSGESSPDNSADEYMEDSEPEKSNEDISEPVTKKSKYFADSDDEEETDIPTSHIPYSNMALHPNSLSFIQVLEKNNNREWFKSHDAEFKKAKQNWDTFILSLAALCHKNHPEHVPAEIPLIKLQFRIHRDMRFSNGLPYKPRWMGGFSPTGCKGIFPKYFLVVWPSHVVVGAGYSAMGDADVGPKTLKGLKDEIQETEGECIAKILRKVQKKSAGLVFKSRFDDAEGLMKEFLEMNVTENMYKYVPKGYDAESPAAGLLKLRSFVIKIQLETTVVMEKDGAQIMASYFKFLIPWVKFLSKYFPPGRGG